MKTRDQVISTRPEGRIQDNKKSKVQIRGQEGRPEGRMRIRPPKIEPKPSGEEFVCLYCGDVFRRSAKPDVCPKCSTPLD